MFNNNWFDFDSPKKKRSVFGLFWDVQKHTQLLLLHIHSIKIAYDNSYNQNTICTTVRVILL